MSLSKFAAKSFESATKGSHGTLRDDQFTSTHSDSNLPFGLTKWQLALIIGTPVLIGAVALYYYNNQDGSSDPTAVSKGKVKPSIKVKPISSDSSKNSTPKKSSLSLPAEILAKNKGNEFFKHHKYKEAAECYTEAIKLCPPNKKEDLATFYQNRAASNEMLGVEAEKIIQDCNEAIKLNCKYTKALIRRSKALEKLNKYEEALVDITAACMLESFGNQTTLLSTDRILRSLSKISACDFVKKRSPSLPSNQFIRHYFNSFIRDPLFPGDREVDSEKLQSKLVELTGKSASQEDDPRINLLKGTIEILKGNVESAEEYLNSVIVKISSTASTSEGEKDEKIDLKVNALIKLGSICLNSSASDGNSSNSDTSSSGVTNIEKALKHYEDAISLDPENADIYIHRAQLLLLNDETEKSKEDLEKCISLAPTFESAIAQRLYVEFRLAMKYGEGEKLRQILREFEETAELFSSSSEILSLFAQSQMEIESYELADKYFLKAIQADPYDANLYVHRAILLLRQNSDAEEAVKLIKKAVRVDPKCQFAHEMLGTILVQMGQIEEAIKSFDLSLECAQTQTDCEHLFSLKDAAKAQLKAAKALGISIAT